MNNLRDAMGGILAAPTPDALVLLQGALLASDQQGESVTRALEVAGRFHSYLSELQSKITARLSRTKRKRILEHQLFSFFI